MTHTDFLTKIADAFPDLLEINEHNRVCTKNFLLYWREGFGIAVYIENNKTKGSIRFDSHDNCYSESIPQLDISEESAESIIAFLKSHMEKWNININSKIAEYQKVISKLEKLLNNQK